MEIYSQTDNGTLYQGDCLGVLSLLPSDSIDTMITDPPYGLSFMGKKWDYEVPGVNVWKQCLRVLKPGATALIFAGSRTQHRMAVNIEDAGFILKDTIMWIYGSGFPKSTDISKQLDKIAGADEAKVWNGWGTALKPAYEPILLCQKPNDGTYAQNALKHGVAGLNIDGGRVEYRDVADLDQAERKSKVTKNRDQEVCKTHIFGKNQVQNNFNREKGRFPANIILDEEAGRLLDEQSGILKSGARKISHTPKKQGSCYGVYKQSSVSASESNTGGASRFFYCAKAPKSERNAGCEELEEKLCGMMEDDNYPIKTGSGNIRETKRRNYHPTVKPLALMEYLVKLTATPTGGTVFDPFAGSGTTGVACILNNRRYTLIEREIEYCEIIMARLGHAWFKNLC